MKKYFRVVGVLILFVCIVPAFAQGGSAALSGKVEDPSGMAVSGAKVQAIDTNTNLSFPTITNSDGLYSFSNIHPGTYRIVVEKEGFRRLERPGVELHVADDISIDFKIEVGSVSQTVTVQGGSPVVDTTSATLGGVVQANEVANLPLNGRNYIGLTLMQPGVVPINIPPGGAYNGTWYVTNGATPRSNNFQLDGAIMQDVNAGSTADFAGRTLGLDGIQEFRIITDNFSAEYGLAMGSQTIMVSKSGTNQFHGNVFDYLRNSVLDAANYFDQGTNANNFERLPHYKRNQFGGSVGGPISKDKTFFFANYEQLEDRLGVTIADSVPAAGCHGAAGTVITVAACPQLGSIPSATIAPLVGQLLALYPLPNLPNNVFTTPYTQPERDSFGQIRLDHTFSSHDNAFARYTIDDDEQDLALVFPEYGDAPRLSRHQYATISEGHTISASLLNSFRFSFSRTYSDRTATTALVGPQYSFVTGLPMGEITVGGLATMGPIVNPGSIQFQNVLTLNDDVYYQLGRHSMKFGTMINRFRQFARATQKRAGVLQFANVAGFLTGTASNFTALVAGSDVDRTWQFYTLGFYAQDDWRLHSNFTLNAGLRYEPGTDYIHEVHGVSVALIHPLTDTALTVGPMFPNPTLHNFSPRLGFAWDVWGNGKTSLRGGASILYDVGNLYNGLNNIILEQPPFSNTQVGSGSFTLPLTFGSAAASATASTVQQNLQQATLYTQSLTLEQQVPFGTVVSLSYVGSRGLHLLSVGELDPNVPMGFTNGIPFWNPNPNQVIPKTNPTWNTVALFGSGGDSVYHALQLVVTRQLSHGLQFQSSYTWSKLIDDQQGETTTDCPATTAFPTDPYSGSRIDRGPSCFDIPQVWVLNYIYNLPSPNISQRLLGAVMRGWGLSGIYTLHSGLPFNPCDSGNRSRSGISGGITPCIDRPNYNPAFTGKVITGNPTQYFNPAAYMLQPVGTLGNVGRDNLFGPGFDEFDPAIKKDTKLGFLGENGNLEFRAEFFNIFNHPNFSMPSATTFGGALTDPVNVAPVSSAGQITSTAGTSRQIELSLRLAF